MIKYNNLKFGCEFEFYPNLMLEEDMIDSLKSLLKDKIKLKINLLLNDDYNMNYKDEPSLSAMGGKEITTPICSYEDLKFYIKSIAKIIDDYGTTNENTGFHIHISTIDNNSEVDFYKFMLLCDNKSLLKNWGNRNSYCLNVMDILTVLNMNEAKEVKNKKNKSQKARIWNLEKRAENNTTNHIEIRTIGGANYQKESNKIINELDKFIEIFNRSIKNEDNDKEYKIILEKHMNIIKSAPKERRDKFLQLI
jgi:hypothetical protein